MFCKYCGSKMPENAKFCQSCGGQTINEVNPQIKNNGPVNNPVVNNNPVNNMPMNNVPINTNKQKNNNSILLIILVIVGICAIAVPLILTANKDSDKKEENTSINTDKKEENTTVNPDNEDDEPETGFTTETYEVPYNGYTFRIPVEYQYMEYEGNLAVLPYENTWIIMFLFGDGEFDQLKNQLTTLDLSLSAQYENVSSKYKTYQGQEYILTNFVSDGNEMRMILVDAGNGKYLMAMLMSLDESVTLDDLFSIAFPMVTSVK